MTGSERGNVPTPLNRTAIVVLNAQGMQTVSRIQTLFPHARTYGLKGRVADVDHTFTKPAETLQSLAAAGTTIIGLCAAGILIRALSSILSNKHTEPPVLAVSDDGAFIVPLLGGLTGANEIARDLAQALDGTAAITASGSKRYGLQLEAPPDGYWLANPEAAKNITSDLLSGATAKLQGTASWLTGSSLPFSQDGTITLRVTPLAGPPPDHGLLYHPRSVVIAFDNADHAEPAYIGRLIERHTIAGEAIAALILTEGADASQELKTFAARIGAAIRYTSAPVPIADLPCTLHKVLKEDTTEIGISETPIDANKIGRCQGHIAIVGLGPGDQGSLTGDVTDALFGADDLVGYQTYLDLVPFSSPGQQRHASGNRVEIDRARQALDLAAQGRRAAVVSSGDPGIFAMAAAVMEAYEAEPRRWPGIDIEVLPGISAMQAAAARLGAPLGHDFCALSLSDIRKPWSIIEERLRLAAKADLVIALYNPASKDRRSQIERAKTTLLTHRPSETPVITARALGRTGEQIQLTTLTDLDTSTIDMRTILIIGSTRTRTFQGPGGGIYAYTPRSYET